MIIGKGVQTENDMPSVLHFLDPDAERFLISHENHIYRDKRSVVRRAFEQHHEKVEREIAESHK